MKNKLFALCLTALVALAVSARDYVDYVNPFIGTGGHGHTFPGPCVPNGMIQPSPDTRVTTWDGCSGYYIEDKTINGFSHTHLSGTGIGDLADMLLMPTVGKQDIAVKTKADLDMSYASPFSHDNEFAEPGYYSVLLDRYGVKAELTAARRAAIHRYTFPASDEAGFVLDWDYANQRGYNHDMEIKVISDTEIIGSKRVQSWAKNRYISFYAKFSKPFSYDDINTPDGCLTWDGQRQPGRKLLLHFNTRQGEQVLVKVGVSAVDADGARRNVEQDIPGWDFEGVRSAARAEWNKYLSAIDIKTENEEQKTIFYTALYHTGIEPVLATDADGRYRGLDQQIHTSKTDIYTIFSLWDTMRALHPLMTIIQPERNQDFIRTLIQKQREGGILPMWELSGNYTGCMIGCNAVPVIVDAYMKGYRDFDTEEAYRAIIRTLTYDREGIKAPKSVIEEQLMPESKRWLGEIGYAPFDNENETVAKGLEYAYNAWCVAEMARERGDKATEARFNRMALSYKNYWDPRVGFMRGRDSKGNWREPFSPISSNHRNDDYCEGNAWQWSWFVPHDVDGLVKLHGSKQKFIKKLDTLFSMSSALEGETVSADISGLIGQYAHGNEPSHHTAYLYDYVGQPWKTQEIVDSVMQTLYFNDPDGLSGNEDCGQMSAWYVLSSMGFYQVCPGRPVYAIGRPLFDEATIKLTNGKTFRVIAHNNSRKAKYVQRMTLNGRPLKTPFFKHSDLTAGATLEVWMGEQPKTK